MRHSTATLAAALLVAAGPAIGQSAGKSIVCSPGRDRMVAAAERPAIKDVERRAKAAGMTLPDLPLAAVNICLASGNPAIVEVQGIVARYAAAQRAGQKTQADALRSDALARIAKVKAGIREPDTLAAGNAPPASLVSFAAYRSPHETPRRHIAIIEESAYVGPVEVLMHIELGKALQELGNDDGGREARQEAGRMYRRWAWPEERRLIRLLREHTRYGARDDALVSRIIQIDRTASLLSQDVVIDSTSLLKELAGVLDASYAAWGKKLVCPATREIVTEALRRARDISLFDAAQARPIGEDPIQVAALLAYVLEDTDDASRASRADAARSLLLSDKWTSSIMAGNPNPACPWSGTIEIRDSSSFEVATNVPGASSNTTRSVRLAKLTLTLDAPYEAGTYRTKVTAAMDGVDSTRTVYHMKDFCGRPAQRRETRLINLFASGGVRDLHIRIGRDDGKGALATFTAPPPRIVSSTHVDSSKSGHPEKRDGNSVCVDDDIPATHTSDPPSVLTPIGYALHVPVTIALDPATGTRLRRLGRTTTRDTIPVAERDPIVRTVTWDLERKQLRMPQ